MKIGEYPKKHLLQVDQKVKKLERAELTVDLKNIVIEILIGLVAQYDTVVLVDDSDAT